MPARGIRHRFIHSADVCEPVNTFTAGTVLGSGATALNQTDENPCLHSSEGRQMLIKKLSMLLFLARKIKPGMGVGSTGLTVLGRMTRKHLPEPVTFA